MTAHMSSAKACYRRTLPLQGMNTTARYASVSGWSTLSLSLMRNIDPCLPVFMLGLLAAPPVSIKGMLSNRVPDEYSATSTRLIVHSLVTIFLAREALAIPEEGPCLLCIPSTSNRGIAPDRLLWTSRSATVWVSQESIMPCAS